MSQVLYRSATIARNEIDIANRTVFLAFSSETPVSRSFGEEVLSHEAGDVDLTWLNSKRAPLLLEHEAEDQIGVVESAVIAPDRVGRALVRFSKNKEAEEVFQDIVDGIRCNVSVGYSITGQRIETRGDTTVVICQWTPKEISIVSIPADEKVGVGRSEELVSQSPSAEANESAVSAVVEANAVEQTITRGEELAHSANNNNKGITMETKETLELGADALRAERARAAEIIALGKRHGVADLSERAIAEGQSIDAFRATVLEQLANKPQVSTSATIGLSDKEVRSYSLARAINAIVTGDFSDAGLELEASRAAAKAQGKVQTRSSIFVPGEYLQRAAGANAVTAAANPNLVNHTQVGFMDVLFNNTIAQRLGVQYMSGLNGVIELPKFTSAAQARFVGEGADGTIDAISSGAVTLSPRTVVAMAELTRSMILNGSAMEQRIQAQLQQAIATKIDAAVFEELLAETGVAWLTKPTTLDYASLRTLIKTVEVANALVDSSKFAFNPIVGNTLSTTVKAANTIGQFLRDDNGNVAGYGSASSNHVGSNLIFGDFSNVTVGNWSTLELAIDTSTKFASGGFLLRAITDVDVAVTRPEAFAGYKAL